MKMEIYGIKTRLIKPGEDIVEIIVKSLEENKIELSDGDVIAIADKVIATADKYNMAMVLTGIRHFRH